MKTLFLLMAQYDGRAVIPAGEVVRDYFPHLTLDKFVRKCSLGDINLPLTRMDGDSQKSAKGVHLTDLAALIDARQAAARKELEQLRGEKSATPA